MTKEVNFLSLILMNFNLNCLVGTDSYKVVGTVLGM